MPSPLLGDFFLFGEGVGELPWKQMRALLSKEGTLIFFSLSFSQLCLCVCVCVHVRATHAHAHTRIFFFRTKESLSLLLAPQIWKDGKPLTPAGQGCFQRKGADSCGAPFLLHVFLRRLHVIESLHVIRDHGLEIGSQAWGRGAKDRHV